MSSVLPRSRKCRWTRVVLVGLLGALACSDDAERVPPVPVEVRDVVLDAASRSPVVVLEGTEPGQVLHIWIGLAEARAIAMQIEKREPPRPLTHDLAKRLLERAGARFESTTIHALRDSTYYAHIDIERADGEHQQVDSRPSDAIALAMRFERPIYVAPHLFVETEEDQEALEIRTIDGVTFQALSPQVAAHFGVGGQTGVLVSGVRPGASDVLRPGDVVLRVEGREVSGVRDFVARMKDVQGDVRLSVQRDGRRLTLRSPALRPD